MPAGSESRGSVWRPPGALGSLQSLPHLLDQRCPGLAGDSPSIDVLPGVRGVAGDHRVMKVEHREGGATGLVDERPLRH